MKRLTEAREIKGNVFEVLNMDPHSTIGASWRIRVLTKNDVFGLILGVYCTLYDMDDVFVTIISREDFSRDV